MEHFDHTNSKSIGGTFITIMFGWLGHVTKEDILVWVSIVAGVITIGYTIHKWYLLVKRKISE